MRLLVILCFLILAPGAVSAQSSDSLVINTIDGRSVKVAISDIKSITFKTLSFDVDEKETSSKLSIYPNPTSESATISFPVEIPQLVTLEIIRPDGLIVRTMKQFCQSGTSSIMWNGLQSDGSPALAGTYFFRVTLREEVLNGKLSLRR